MIGATRSRFSKRKAFVLFSSLIIGAIVWFCAYEYFASSATNYELNRPIDIQNSSGFRRMKIYTDSTSIAGVAFCLTAISLILATRKKVKK